MMRMKAFFILFVSMAYSQRETLQSQHLIDSLIRQSNANASFSLLRSDTQELLTNRINTVDTVNELSCKEICDSFYGQRSLYDSTRIPSTVDKLYKAASKYVDDNMLREGLKLYYIAFAFRKDFIEKEKKRITANYNNAKEFLIANSKDSLREYVDKYDRENISSPAFIILENELQLKAFYDKIRKSIVEQEIKLKYEQEHAEHFENNFAAYFGTLSNITYKRESPTIRVTDDFFQKDTLLQSRTLLDDQQPKAAIVYVAGFSVKVLENVYVNAQFSYGTFTIRKLVHRLNLLDFVIVDNEVLRIITYNFVVTSRYIHRTNIGLRPFIEAGAGLEYNFSEEKKLYTIDYLTFYSIQQKNVAVNIPLTLGMEYAYSKDSRLLYSAKFGINTYWGDTNYSGKLSTLFAVNLAYVVL